MKPLFLRAKGLAHRAVLPQYLCTQVGDVIESFEDNADWTPSANATITDDTTNFTEGTQSVNVAASGSDANGTKTVSLALSEKYDCMRIDLYLSNTLVAPTLYLTSVSNLSKYFSKAITGSQLRAGWNRFTIIGSDWTNTGGESWANQMIRLRIRHDSTGNNLSFDNFKAGVVQQGAVVIGFDDGWSEQYTNAYSYMLTKHMKGTINMVSDFIDTAGYCTTAQLQEMYAAGWDIANHSKTHTNFTTLTQAQIETEISSCRSALESKGLDRGASHVVYPQGGYDADTQAAMTAQSAKTGRRGYGTTDLCYPVLPQIDLYQMQAFQLDTTISLADAKAWVDYAVSHKVVLNFFTHKVTATPGAGDYSIADFEELIDYIVTSGLPCLTVSQLYDLESGPVIVTLPY